MLNKISLKNYKAFGKAEIELKPITILVGPNNSGKSSLIQSILLIQQTLESGNNVINTSSKKFSSFYKLVNQESNNNEIGFRLDFNDKTYIEFTIKGENKDIFINNFTCSTESFKYSLNNLNIDDYNKEKNIVENPKKCILQFNEQILEKKRNIKI